MGRHGENIRKRKDGRWEARMITGYDASGKAKYRSFYGKTYLEAKEKRNQALGRNQEEITAGKRSVRKITVAQVMEEWLKDRKTDVKESTYAQYANLTQNHILPQLGEISLEDLNPEMISQFLKEKLKTGRIDRKGGLSPKTVSDIRSVLLLGLEYARRQKYDCFEESKIFSPKHSKTEMKVLTREEQSRLEEYLSRHIDPLSLGVLTTLYGGFRIGEICALQWGDIHFESGVVQIHKTIIRIQNTGHPGGKKTRILISRPKTESSRRMVPLPTFLLDLLKSVCEKPEIYLITGTKAFMEPRMYLEKYKQILKQAGLDSFSFHTLRHTFATRCVESGFDIKSLSEILGHASVSTTLQNYVHPSLELKKEQMERLQNVLIWGQKHGTLTKENEKNSKEFQKTSHSILL